MPQEPHTRCFQQRGFVMYHLSSMACSAATNELPIVGQTAGGLLSVLVVIRHDSTFDALLMKQTRNHTLLCRIGSSDLSAASFLRIHGNPDHLRHDSNARVSRK